MQGTRFEHEFNGKKLMFLLLTLMLMVSLTSYYFPIILKGGKEMDTEIAYIIVGVMILVAAIVGAGIIYSGLEKIAKAIEKKK
jgi:hypothetical protein